MRENMTQAQIEDSMSLTPDAEVFLFKIILNAVGGGQVLHVTGKAPVTWQGMKFERIGISLTGEGVNTRGEAVRPKLSVVNPDGAFSAFVAQKKLDQATIIRYTVPKKNVDANINGFYYHQWRITKTLVMNKSMLSFELRSPLDGHNFMVPGDAFFPPEFPHVSLQ